MKKVIIILTIFLLSATAYASVVNDTTTLYFDTDIAELNSSIKKRLDSLAYYDAISTRDIITIVGYADYVGDTAYNKVLSQKRADNVKAYLLTLGLNEKNIILQGPHHSAKKSTKTGLSDFINS